LIFFSLSVQSKTDPDLRLAKRSVQNYLAQCIICGISLLPFGFSWNYEMAIHARLIHACHTGTWHNTLLSTFFYEMKHIIVFLFFF
jgi:hypothetical protein